MASTPNFDRNDSTTLNAKLHQGYDPGTEHKDQGNLYGSVAFDQQQSDQMPVLTQILDGVTGALRSAVNAVENIFEGNAFNVNDGDNNLPSADGGAGPQLLGNNAGGNIDQPARFGSEGRGLAPLELNTAIGASPSPVAATQNTGARITVTPSLVTGTDPTPDPPTPNPPTSVDPVNPPVISAPPVTGSEDHAAPITIGLSIDPASVTSITIGNVPSGGLLSAGINNSDGTWTLTVAQLSGLTFMPPYNASGVFNLTVTATSVEDGITVSTNANLAVTITGVADTPIVSAQNANGNEDTVIPLHITALLTDLDGSENLSVVISNMPNGAMLSAGIDNHNGTWTLTPAQLIGLTFTPPIHVSGNFDLSVTAISSEDGTTATASTHLFVDVTGVATPPILSVMASSGDEDTAIALHINAALQITDGSETLSIVIGNVPNGAVLSAGVDNHDGTWTLTSADLVNLTITPPQNSDVDFHLSVTAISTDSGHWAMSFGDIAVNVEGVADLPNLIAVNVNGNEDSAIALNIAASLNDTDGSENLAIVISNVPNGAVLSAGVNNHNGTWTLTRAQLTGLTITPPEHFSGTLHLDIAATASENNTYATASASIDVNVAGVATPPLLHVVAATGNEDTAIALNINAALADTDSETLAIVISNVPTGAILSAGIDNHNGTWNLTAAQLAGLTITPPLNSNADFTLHVTATSTENATTSSVTLDLPVNVIGVADLPSLSVAAASGNEDSAIALNITAALSDTDGSENLSIDIGGVPNGAILSAGFYTGNGHWSLTAAQLSGLTITPPPGYDGSFNLSVTAIATENDGDHIATSVATLGVTVNPVVHTPVITAGVAVGNEDTPIALNITLAAHAGDVVSVLISGVPTGATLSAGIDNHNGSWTLTEAQLANLTITPPHNSDVDFNLSVTATATASDGTVATDTSPLQVVVNAVADAPNVLAANVSGAIDTHIGLNISGSLNDTDGSESITYVIAGVPDGFSFNHGSNNGNNKWTFTSSELSGLTLTSPYHFQGTLNLTAYSISHEAENGSVALSASDAFTVTIGDPLLGVNINLDANLGVAGIGAGTGVGIGATVPNVLDPAGIVLMEDSPLLLNGLTTLLGNVFSPLQMLSLGSVTLGGLPAGVTLSDGVNLGNGTYQLSTGQLNNLYLISSPNSDQDFTLSINANLLSLAMISVGLVAVHVVGVADVPTLTVDPVSAMEGDALIPLSIHSALTDTDGSEMLNITLTNLPAGFMCNIGINNADGSWTISVAQLANLALIAPANFSGDATYTVTATSTEREGDSSNHIVTGQIHIGAVTDAPIVNAPDNHANEGSPIALNLGISLADNDGSEHLASVVVGGLGTGFSLSHGVDNHDGTFTVNPSDLGHLQLITPNHWSGDAHLTVTATSQEGLTGTLQSTTGNVNVHVEAHADVPTLSVQNETGNDASPIALHINAGLTDTDGSEHLSVVLSGMQNGVTLSAGLHNSDGTWTLSQSDLAHLSLSTNDNFSGDLHLTATAVAQEQSNGDTASASQNFTVHVDHAVDHAFHA